MKSKNLRNAVLFRLRQWFTLQGSDSLQPLQEEVFNEVMLTCRKSGKPVPGKVISYAFMDRLLRVNKNPDYFSGLPMQSAQAIARETVSEFESWLKALAEYQKDPSLFTGKPKMPKYTKAEQRMITMTNQDCTVYGKYLKLPKTKERLAVMIPEGTVLKEVKIRPYYGEYEMILVCEQETETEEVLRPYVGGIDFGVDNIIAFVCNDGFRPVLYKGGAVKAKNQSYNKAKAEYTGILMKGHDPKEVNVHTERMKNLGRKRDAFMRDEMHRISTHLIRECERRNIGTIVIGKNDQWKTNAGMSKKSNQTFVQIPHSILAEMIRYKAERKGISVIEQEESYTSRASFIDHDEIPVYGEKCRHEFSGKRIRRGLYRTKDGTVINADINGSANIIRKAIPEAFEGMTDFAFLQSAETVGFRDLHPLKAKQM